MSVVYYVRFMSCCFDILFHRYVPCYWHFFIPVPITMATLLFWYWYSVNTRVVALSGYSTNVMNSSLNET
jgi:hypothetical protein